VQTLPGVDRIGAARLLVEIGTELTAFGRADGLASWAGSCPSNHESAGKGQSSRMRQGNPCVRRLLCEFAHAASRTAPAFHSKFQSLVICRCRKRAIVAIAHKLSRMIFVMLQRQQPHRDEAMEHAALAVQRHAPRWIKALTKFGYLTPAHA
jgi:transposase